MSGRQRVGLQIRHRGVGAAHPLLQHERVSDVRDKEQMHPQQEGEANNALGGRSDTGANERKSESESGEDEKEEGDSRTSIRNDEARNAERIFFNERDKESSSRDEPDCDGLQHKESDQYIGSEKDDRGSCVSSLKLINEQR